MTSRMGPLKPLTASGEATKTISIKALCAVPYYSGSACPQPEPNATELPSCASISASRELLTDDGGGGGGGVARRARAAPAPKAMSCAPSCGTSNVLHHILRHVLRRVLDVVILLVSPKGKCGGRHACVGRGFRC